MFSLFFNTIFNRETKPQKTNERTLPWIVPRKVAGMTVTQDTALNVSTVFACIRVIAEDIGKIKSRVFVRNGDERRVMPTHPVDRLLFREPNPEMCPMTFKETLIAWALSWGNGYAEIVKDAAGRPAELWPVSPDRVQPRRSEMGQYYYYIPDSDAAILPENMLHIHGLGFDGLTGYSIVNQARQTIGQGLAGDEFQSNFYENGTVLSGHLEHPGQLGDKAFDRLKEEIKKYEGVKRAHKTAIFEEGMKYVTDNMPLTDAQFLESRRFGVEEICRWFRMSPHKVSDLSRAHFSNIEHQEIQHVSDCLLPWAVRFEQECNRKLLPARNTNLYVKINLNELLRGDIASRTAHYKEMWQMGAMSADEIRALEDQNPLPDGQGQKYWVQTSYMPVEDYDKQMEMQNEEAKDQVPGEPADEETDGRNTPI